MGSLKGKDTSKARKNKSEEIQRIDFIVVLEEVGSMGKYQLLLILIAYWVTFTTGVNQIASVFESATPYHRCALPPLDDVTFFPNVTEEELRNWTLSLDPTSGDYDQCNRYNYNISSCVPGHVDECITPYPPTIQEVEVIPCDQGYWYDTTVYPNTIITEWNIVCDQQILGALVSAAFFCGVLLSSLIGGTVTDIFGRSPTMIVTQLCTVAVGVGCAFAPNLHAYACFRLAIGFFINAGYIACFVYVLEVTGSKWRTVVGVSVQITVALGGMVLTVFAYAWRDWRDLQLAISFVPLPFILFWFFLPESPRWLFTKGKVDKAKKISLMMAEKNGRKLSEDIWKSSEKIAALEDDDFGRNFSPVDLFRRQRMRRLTLNLMFIWFSVSMVYYGLSLNAGELSGDNFVNNTLNCFLEVVANFFVILVLDRVGRKPFITSSLVAGGLACLVSTVAKEYSKDNTALQITSTAFALIGKMAISGSFAAIYNYSAELYPTVVRSTAIGFVSMSARLGSIIAPFILQLQYIMPWITNVVLGVLALIASLTSIRLPETLGNGMMTSLDEAERFYAGERKKQGNIRKRTTSTKVVGCAMAESLDLI